MTFFEVNVSSILRTSVRNPVTTLIIFVYVQAFCQAMVDKFSSIDMKSTSTKSVLELKGELRLICCDNDTWELWTRVFDLHSSGDLVNPDTEEKFNAVEGGECPPINREFFRYFKASRRRSCRGVRDIPWVRRLAAQYRTRKYF